MTNLVLYRKYRPKTFGDVMGQEHVIRVLTNALLANKVSHAYLFTGPRGTGKTSMARLLAKAVNCENLQTMPHSGTNCKLQTNYEPCNQCSSCREINQGKAIDLIEIDAASNRGIDEMRELREGIKFVPVKSKYKVFVIDECHQLTKEAANALLKTLEEPPMHAIFILATTEPQKMIATIISRCQRFDFCRLKAKEIFETLEKILKQEKIDFEPQALNLIALSSCGSLRDAETLLDQAISFSGAESLVKKEIVEKILGITDNEIIFKFLNYVFQKQTKSAVEFLEEIIYKGIDLQEFAKTLIIYLRGLLLLKISPGFQDTLILLSEEEKEKFNELAKNLSEKELKDLLEKIMAAETKMKYSSLPQLLLELAIIE
ncbi:DNA polymerase III subunit gamma/tau [Patescibacteria group bacterium]|nr:DNA polymerase III subunit gamma/tau [Patescibacteria group bacterium]